MKFLLVAVVSGIFLAFACCGGGGGGGGSTTTTTPSPSFVKTTSYGIWIASMAFHPTNPNIIYFGHDDAGGLYKSADGGSTIQYVETGFRNISAWTIAINPANANEIYVGDSYGYGVYKSTDGGTTWAFKNTGLAGGDPLAVPAQKGHARVIHSIIVDPSLTTTVFAFTNDGFYRSTDSGNTWIKPANQPAGIPKLVGGEPTDLIYMAATSTGRLFVGGGAGKLYFSSDKGDNWTLRRDFGTEAPVQEISDIDIDATDGNLYVTTMNTTDFNVRVYRGTFNDAAVTWIGGSNPYPPFTSSIAFAQLEARGTTKYLGVWGSTNGGVWRTTDDGTTWTAITGGVSTIPANKRTIFRLYLHPGQAGPTHLFFSGFENFFRTTNANAATATDVAWTDMTTTYGLTTSYLAGLAVDPQNTNTVYIGLLKGPVDAVAAGYDPLLKSTDGGTTWSSLVNFQWNPVSLSVQSTSSAVIIGGTFESGIKRSADTGANWSATNVSAGLVPKVLFHPNTIATYKDLAFAAVRDPAAVSGIYRSTDAGANWTKVLSAGGTDTGVFTDVVISSSNPDIVYASGQISDAGGNIIQGGVWVSADKGVTWNNKGPTGAEGTTVAQDPTNAAVLFCGTLLGLFRTTNGQDVTPTWTKVDPGWQGTISSVLHRSSQEVYATMHTADNTPVFLSSPTHGLWRSLDGGTNWTYLSGSVNPTDNFWLGTFLPGNNKVIMLPAYGGGLFRYVIP